MRLIVGLGNPGQQYVRTPHNLGFLAIDRLAERVGVRVRRPEGEALVGVGRLAGREIVLAKPQTFMNASGVAVRGLIRRFEADSAEMIVVADDAALPWGAIRIRERGSAGGHNGLKSVIGMIESQQFIRIRLGVGPVDRDEDLAEYVLRPMSGERLEQAAEMAEAATAAVEWILRNGTAAAMNRFNRRANGLAGEQDLRTPGRGGN